MVKYLFKIFKNLKIETNKSYANFLLISFNKIKRNSKKIFLNLASSGIIVREMSVYNIKNCLRVSIGSSIENKKFIYKLKKLLMFNKISIIGCGLIGSSILRAIKQNSLAKTISVYDKSKDVLEFIKKRKYL